MRLRIKTLIAAVSLLISTLVPLSAQALAVAAPRVYFGQSSYSAQSGNNLRIPLRLDAAGTPINTVDVILNFPDSQLSFVSLDKSGSYFDTVVPSAPTVSGGKLEFAAAALSGGSTSGDVLIGTLVFNAKVSKGTAQITSNGSEAANDGKAIDVTPGSTNVVFAGGSSTNTGLQVSNITVSSITVNGGTIRWHTDLPASSSVDYGTNTNYGFTATTDGLTTNHVVQLDSVFAGAVKVHFAVTSVDANGNSKTSTDQSFVTKGYTIAITVTDKGGKAISGAKVSVAGGMIVKTNSDGLATISNVRPGNQKVVINSGKTQFIAVKATPAKAATNIQTFKLTAERGLPTFGYVVLTVLVVVALLTLAWLMHKKRPEVSTPQV